MNNETVVIRSLGLKDYESTWHAMHAFTAERNPSTLDEIWLLEHPPIFTLGQNGKPEHLINPKTIPVLKVDRGGQVTYHGPGQLVAYVLIDLHRKKWNVRQLVSILEESIIAFLQSYQLNAYAKAKAPGIYIDEKKICSIGLRIRRGCSFHGLAINIKMDMEPFSNIHPCGFKELVMTQLSEFYSVEIDQVREAVTGFLTHNLGFTHQIIKAEEWHGS